MFVRQMSYLVMLAREKHFTRAATKCNVTQSTLSAGLKALERELDMPLVLRGPRFIGLTPEGERVVTWASQIISDYANLKQDVAELRSGLKGNLRLGVVPAAMPVVARLTSPFCAKHPGIAIDVVSMTSADIQSGVEKFEIDAGLTYLENEPLPRVRKSELYRERYLFVTHIGNPLANQKTVTWKDAVAHNLCLLNRTMQNRRVLNNITEALGLKLAPTITSNSYLAICSHVCTGEWSSIIPHTFSYIFAGCKDLTLIDLAGPRHSQPIGLVVSDRDPLSPVAFALVRCASHLRLDEYSAPAHPPG